MSKLPDLEGLAIFAKVVELRSFAGAADELGLSKATVSKAVTRLETRLGARLFNRTSRRLALTDAGQSLAEPATGVLAQAEAAESAALAQSSTPRGLVRLAAPMSFGLSDVAPVLPGFMAAYPEVSVDLHLSDATVDLIGMGFDAALRIADLPDSSLVARRLRAVKRYLVASPAYLDRRGRPTHPGQLAEHCCLGYAYLPTPDTWRFVRGDGEEVSVRPAGALRANNADALMPALLAGLGLAVLPDFIAGAAIAGGRLEAVMPDWSPPPIALHLVTPPGGPRPARVEALTAYLASALGSRGL
ncbi:MULTISPECIES: LysR family transcriptional regulator [unclassified Caulobacter]|uniref:LysR family transcriptional regulator n=1 Tax=unclassified Caulobacter TaxID=2648921 RepID=UPI000D34FC66|nr:MULTISPECIES: LysR family transcriptional regulator [unclassified Caulobacter]PTS90522.1 LysR family transcriptional regulator [Caulobacter sp. HMWF009]PTT09938.1 LysR family transcriptional regulator [Caulobacter sp. HMWF025]